MILDCLIINFTFVSLISIPSVIYPICTELITDRSKTAAGSYLVSEMS